MKEILKLDHIQNDITEMAGMLQKQFRTQLFRSRGRMEESWGASGSGKTQFLLNCISTIDTVSAGHIYLDGTDATEINEKTDCPVSSGKSWLCFPRILTCWTR